MVSSVQMNRGDKDSNLGRFQSIQMNRNSEEVLYDYQPRLNTVEKK